MTGSRLPRWLPLVAAATLVACGGTGVAAQEKPGWSPISREDQAVFDGMVRASTPGEPHKLLGTLAGDWTFTSKIWMNPDLPPEQSSGTATNTMMMGGRYLKTSFSGQLMGVSFEGVGITGYDNTSGRYQAVWFDNTSTVLMFMSGTQDAAGKTIVLTGEMNDLAHPTVVIPVREVLTFVEANTHTMEMFETRNGRQIKTLELTYRRKP